ncbi:MAG: di-trans,poly-cis-decaprenylcistransferase [Ferrovum sp.]|jgi:undecaprenyl diphosphate synthase|uniref:polyprenyl diphosphate synthase n=1 Tax=Ferrovum sp. TaxID=2609467 RepID=UPI0026063660|nr:polyprenyl diphosphate synthase [Ferrovum sp.]MBW8067906.1 di-trans,poly-cis-decaprenylcistransferase [Ferrovum sp.]
MVRAKSSTQTIPDVATIPRHIAIIMDGNGRWARQRLLPRIAGHRKGSEAVRTLVESGLQCGIPYLTLFAFSSENWRRPADEVSLLMQLFMHMLEKEIQQLHGAGVRLRVIGDRSPLGHGLQALIEEAERLTLDNQALTLTLAVNYGGRWDILQAVNAWRAANPAQTHPLTEADLQAHLCLSDLPEPDLFIRTGGEQRISNFLLWQLAYTELYFTETLWPDFDRVALDLAILSYQGRERRFGRTSEQCSALGS